MTARAIVSGVLTRAAQQRTSKSGNPYVLATVRDGNGDAVRWWSVIAFNAASMGEILKLREGDPIAISGEFDAEIYRPDGKEPRVSWKITADAILSARRPAKERKPEPKASTAFVTDRWAGSKPNDAAPV